ncbi:MAG: TolC family protein, partial [Rhodobacterales bacterium]|nr:TolC family protein [Rhodobacterales bacterium]MDX5498923.1 TolC family protein [Rhodobacterales bacterium]
LRVRGGVSNMSEQTVLKQKLNEMQATLQADRDAEMLAASELDAMAQAPVSASAGLTDLPGAMPGVTPLAVHLAEAQKERTLAELKVSRADYLPGLGASTNIGKGGIGVSGGIENGLGLGNKAALEAVTAGADAATARVAQAARDAARDKQALELKIANLDRQETAQADVARQMRANLKRFEEQYKAGVRPLMDLVTQHENLAAMERDLVNMRHERARARLEIARDLGVLADGAGI